MKIEILADDFTGANDIGIQLRKYGLKVTSVIKGMPDDSDVTVISSETRNKNELDAYKKVKGIYKLIKEKGYDKFYKKIDSTLRGPIKAELDAIIEQLDSDKRVAVVVGFPKTNRKIINGEHFIGDTALHETQFKNDPVYSIRDNNLRNYFGGEVITLSEIRGDLVNIINKSTERVLIFDTETDSDLDIIAKALVETKLDNNVVGSSGIMEYLMKYWGYSREKVMLIAGSCNIHNIRQVEEFLNCGLSDVSLLELYPVDKVLEGTIKENSDIVIRSIREIDEMEKTLEKYSFDEISDYIAEEAKNIIINENIKNLIICGGETSLKILSSLNINYLEIQKQVDDGISLGKFEDYKVITKPGGFGQNNFYKIAYEELKNADIINKD